MTIDEKIKIIEQSESFASLPYEALPPSHKENYYFVSYSHKDYKMVLKDILRLEELGVNIWYDTEMHIGENWREIAQLYISKFQCAGIIFYLTENSICSPACNKEVEYVLAHNKNFLSINKPLEGSPVQSGYAMLKQLKDNGFKCEQDLLDNFERAFSDEILYLSVDDSIENKARQLMALKREDLLQISAYRSWKGAATLEVSSCRDNTLINLDISKIYEVDGLSQTISAIGDCVFTNSVKLQSVKLPKTLTRVGESAFRNCFSLTDIDFSDISGLVIDKNAFRNCVSLEGADLSRVERIDERAFYGCKKFKTDVVSGEISASAFGDTSIEAIEYVAKRPVIKMHAFWGCKSLKSIKIINKFTDDLGDSAFYSCEALEHAGDFIAPWSLDLGDKKYLDVGANCFNGCSSLKDIKFIGSWDFSGAMGAFWGCESLENMHLNVGGEIIADNFARGCKSLKVVDGGTQFTQIGEEAFEQCSSLESFDFSAVKTIQKAAFVDSGLKSAYLKNIEYIGKSAFANCKSMKKVTVGADCKRIESFAFLGCSELAVFKSLCEDVSVEKSNDVFSYTDIKVFYLRSAALLELIKKEGVLDKLSVLYLGDNLDASLIDESVFERCESDENGFFKFERLGADQAEEEEEEVDVTADELNEPDPARQKYNLNDADLLLGKEIMLKHVRLKKPYRCFVEQVAKVGVEVDYLTLSVHTGKSFKVDGTLIEEIAFSDVEFVGGLKCDEAYELNGSDCCIVANGDFYYCKILFGEYINVFGVPMPDFNLKYTLKHVICSEGEAMRAFAGGDIESLTVFDENFQAKITVKRKQ